jgi:hypothetical protein
VEVDGQVFVDAAARAEALWEPLTPEEEAAAHQAVFERHRGLAGNHSTVVFGVSEPAPEPGADDEYL